VITVESTATVDEAHRLTVSVPDSVPPGKHPVLVVIRDCPAEGAADRGPIRFVPDFIARQKAVGMTMFTEEETAAFDKWLAGESE
jgi:hypothetical protein